MPLCPLWKDSKISKTPWAPIGNDAEDLLGPCGSFFPSSLLSELLESWLPCYCSCSLLNWRQKRIPSVITYYQRRHGSAKQGGAAELFEHCSALSTTDTNTLCSYPFCSVASRAVKSEQVHHWFAPGVSVWLPMLIKLVQYLQVVWNFLTYFVKPYDQTLAQGKKSFKLSKQKHTHTRPSVPKCCRHKALDSQPLA